MRLCAWLGTQVRAEGGWCDSTSPSPCVTQYIYCVYGVCDAASIAARTLERLPATKVIKGDVTDLASVKEAMEGCQACIMCR
jgi:hypothetical protein